MKVQQDNDHGNMYRIKTNKHCLGNEEEVAKNWSNDFRREH